MQRILYNSLIEWKKNPQHLPLLLRGARQVGKTYLVEKFGRKHFKNLISINFERDPHYKNCFSELDPKKILTQIELLTGQKITAGESLLFFDEIQECPQAIQSLRYFKEEYSQLHVIGAGSLLEFTLQQANFSMPVGRVQFLYLKPLSFKEFLWAQQKEHLYEYLKHLHLHDEVPKAVHAELLTLVRLYLILGGMPAVLNSYFTAQSIQEARNIQTALLQSYRTDFGKYTKQQELTYLEAVFTKLPAMVSQQVKYSKLDPEALSRNLKAAVEKLTRAGLITPVFASNASGLPLAAHKNERKFKALFIDVGLMLRACQVDPSLLVQEDVLFLLQGAMMEQFVGQELLAYQNPYETPELYFWSRDEKSAQAEIDYLEIFQTQILPIEVKSKSLGHLKSLYGFMKEKKSPIGIRISEHPLNFQKNVLSIPLYMIAELPRLIREIV